MRVVLFGAGGMLATALEKAFASEDLIPLAKQQCNLTKPPDVRRMLTEVRPAIILNAAAYTAVDEAELHEELATAVNGTAVGTLAAVAREIGALVVHYSTDYVFPGVNASGYAEDAPTGPVNAYGRSKLAGELALRASGADHYLIRTAWLYGPNGKNFVDTVLRLANERGRLSVVTDQTGSPTFTRDLARATHHLVNQRPPFGTYHRTNDGAVTWYGLAQAVFEIAGVAAELTPVTTAQFQRPAPRPACSILRSTKLPPLRPWRAALEEYLTARSSPFEARPLTGSPRA